MTDDKAFQPWLFRPKPLEDELLSSWLVRCAYANARKLHAFCSHTWGTRHHFWERDLDRTADVRLLEGLADCTCTQRPRAYATTLAAYEGMLFEYFAPSGELPWIMPVGKRGRDRYGFGMQFCPRCLAEDKAPYYRRAWRLSCGVVCPAHGCYLHDCCPACNAPVTFHQGDYGEKSLPDAGSIVRCIKCGFDRRSAEVVMCGHDERGNSLIGFQVVIAEAIRDGWARQPGKPEKRIMSLPFFNGLHDLMRALCSRSRTGRLREGCVSEMGLDDNCLKIVGPFDSLRIKERGCILDMAAWLIDCWPDRLVKIAQSGKVASSYFFGYKTSTAFWFYSAINENLNRAHYHPSKMEIQSCYDFINSQGLLNSKNNLQRWLGRYYVDKRKYTKLTTK